MSAERQSDLPNRAKLRATPELKAKTVFELLQQQYPGRYEDGQLRTPQRHVKRWRAAHGPDREVALAQQHRPGEAVQADFMHAIVTIFKDPMTAAAIDRLVHHAIVVEMTGKSIRVEHAQAERSAEGASPPTQRETPTTLPIPPIPSAAPTALSTAPAKTTNEPGSRDV